MTPSQFLSIGLMLAVIIGLLTFIAAKVKDIYNIVNDRISAD